MNRPTLCELVRRRASLDVVACRVRDARLREASHDEKNAKLADLLKHEWLSCYSFLHTFEDRMPPEHAERLRETLKRCEGVWRKP